MEMLPHPFAAACPALKRLGNIRWHPQATAHLGEGSSCFARLVRDIVDAPPTLDNIVYAILNNRFRGSENPDNTKARSPETRVRA
jgi:hypothetical protein